jgi:hypothetical protein
MSEGLVGVETHLVAVLDGGILEAGRVALRHTELGLVLPAFNCRSPAGSVKASGGGQSDCRRTVCRAEHAVVVVVAA